MVRYIFALDLKCYCILFDLCIDLNYIKQSHTYIKQCYNYGYLFYQVRADIAVDTKHQTMTGVTFPITDEARFSLLKLQNDEINYVQLVGKFMLLNFLKYAKYFDV